MKKSKKKQAKPFLYKHGYPAIVRTDAQGNFSFGSIKRPLLYSIAHVQL